VWTVWRKTEVARLGVHEGMGRTGCPGPLRVGQERLGPHPPEAQFLLVLEALFGGEEEECPRG